MALPRTARHFSIFARTIAKVHAVSGVSLHVARSETLGLVGESGSGKSTVGRCLLRLIEPTSGSIKYKGQELTSLDRGGMRNLRRELQMVFQDPYSSLDPRMTVGAAVGEPFDRANLASLRLHREHQAGAHRLIVEDHRAGAADAMLATDMRAGLPAFVADGIDQRLARLDADGVIAPVDGQRDVELVSHMGRAYMACIVTL